MPNEQRDEQRQECWDLALQSFGTFKIFEHRFRKLQSHLRLLQFLGITAPLSVGAAAVSFGINAALVSWTMFLVAPLSIALAIASAYSLVSQWEAAYGYARDSMQANNQLFKEFERLAKQPPNDEAEFRTAYETLRAGYDRQDKTDLNQAISDEEKRYGYQHGMFQFQRKCSMCHKIPVPQSPSLCTTCGKTDNQ